MKPFIVVAFFVFLLSGCAAPVKNEGPAYFNTIPEAAQGMAQRIADQARFSLATKSVPVDTVINQTSAEVASSSKELQTQLAAALSKAMPLTRFEAVTAANVASAQWIILTTFSPADARKKEGGALQIQVALAEVATGKRIAFASGYLPTAVFATDPTAYYKDSPIYNTNHAGTRAKLAALNGQGTSDLGISLRHSALYGEGVAYYEDGQYSVAAKKFFDILKLEPNHMGALSGLYQSYWRSGLKKEAEQAFLMLGETGIDTGMISVRMMFSVGSTSFVNSGDLPEQYRVWQKSLAQAAVNRNRCFDVVGHASKTGAEDYNEKLSLQRATRIAGNMVQLVPASRGKFKAVGKGSAEVIVGNGADDMSDAIDRRVEFSVRGC